MYEAGKRSSGNVIILVFRQKLRRQGKFYLRHHTWSQRGRVPHFCGAGANRGHGEGVRAITLLATPCLQNLPLSPAGNSPCPQRPRPILHQTRFFFQSESMHTQTRTMTRSVFSLIYCALFKHTEMHQLKISTLFIPAQYL